MFILHLSALSASCVSILFQSVVRMSSISMSGMPNKAHPFPGNIKKLHILSFFFCSIFTLHMPIYVTFCSIECFYWVFLFLVINRIFLFLLLVTFLFQAVNHSTSYASIHLSKMVDPVALCTFLTIGWA